MTGVIERQLQLQLQNFKMKRKTNQRFLSTLQVSMNHWEVVGQNLNMLMGLIPSCVVVRTGIDWNYDCNKSVHSPSISAAPESEKLRKYLTIKFRTSTTKLSWLNWLFPGAELCFMERSVICRHVYCLSLSRRRKTHKWPLKIQLASNWCLCSPDVRQRYRFASLQDTLVGNLWPRRIIGPTCSAAWDINCVEQCTAPGHVCHTSEIMYVCERKDGGNSSFGGALRGMWVCIIVSLRTKAHPC